MDKVSHANEVLMNSQYSLENYCEKYMPLRMINLIVESTEDCFNAKQKNRLKEITSHMGELFRAEVLTDLGNPALRHACL